MIFISGTGRRGVQTGWKIKKIFPYVRMSLVHSKYGKWQ
jgi:hypothetical protein